MSRDLGFAVEPSQARFVATVLAKKRVVKEKASHTQASCVALFLLPRDVTLFVNAQ